MAAGFHNLFENNEQNFLEQAVCADELTEASVQFLRDQSPKVVRICTTTTKVSF